MKRLWVPALGILLFVLIGCTSAYKVSTLSDEFTDPNSSLLMKTMSDNYILSYADPLKLNPSSQLNAYIMLDKKTNRIAVIGLSLINVRRSGGIMNARNSWLQIQPGNEMIILTDTKRIVLVAERPRTNTTSSYNSVTYSVDTNYFDFAFYPMTEEDFKILAMAQSVKLKIYGQNGADEYKEYLNNGLLPNFLKFYQEEILSAKEQKRK